MKAALLGRGDLLAPAVVLTSFLRSGQCKKQRPITITFEGPPDQPTNSAYIAGVYSEGGMFFTQHSGFVRIGPEAQWRSNNGTAFITSGNSLGPIVTAENEYGLFSLFSLDLAEFNTYYAEPLTVRFVGYKPGGATVVVDVTTDGTIDGTGPLAEFEAFQFEAFTGLNWLGILGDGFSLDNMIVVIPEPAATAVLPLGGCLVCAGNRRSAGHSSGDSLHRYINLGFRGCAGPRSAVSRSGLNQTLTI